jgi:hypothetical protein
MAGKGRRLQGNDNAGEGQVESAQDNDFPFLRLFSGFFVVIVIYTVILLTDGG